MMFRQHVHHCSILFSFTSEHMLAPKQGPLVQKRFLAWLGFWMAKSRSMRGLLCVIPLGAGAKTGRWGRI